MNDIVKINPDKVKNYVVSSKACKISVIGCRLQPKFGKVIFNLSIYKNIEKCVLHMRKVGGNGALVIVKPSAGSISVISKTLQCVEIKPNKDGLVYLMRPAYSTGDIDIFGIVLYLNDKQGEIKSMPDTNWKYIISRCKKHKGLRLIRGKLFASNGGFIDGGGLISYCETDPPNLFTNDKSKIVFTNSCRIVDIKFKSDVDDNIIAPPKLEFTHKDPPKPLIIKYDRIEKEKEKDEYESAQVLKKINIDNIKNIIDNNNEHVVSDNIIYDSYSMNGFDAIKVSNNNLIKCININGKDYVVLKNGGVLDIPISLLEPNQTYICVINCKKYSGNGKLYLQFVDGNKTSMQHEVILNTSLSNKYKKITTPNSIEYGHFYKLRISSVKSITSGEILINRIIILKDISIQTNKEQNEEVADYYINNKVYIDAHIDRSDIYKISKIFAIHNPLIIPHNVQRHNMYGEIFSNTISGIRYLNKIKNLFPNIKYKNKSENSLLISEAGKLQECNKIWIDVFDELEQKDIDILQKAKFIFTPSLSNQQYLSDICSDSEVICQHKPLPYVPIKFIKYLNNKKYIVLFNRCSTITKYIIDIWDRNISKIVLVGGTGRYPNFVIPVNEYLPYDELLYILFNSKAVLDIPKYSEYFSSFLSLASDYNIPIISSNFSAINYKNSIYLNPSDKIDDGYVPCSNDIITSVQNIIALDNKICNQKQYNRKVKDTIKLFVN